MCQCVFVQPFNLLTAVCKESVSVEFHIETDRRTDRRQIVVTVVQQGGAVMTHITQVWLGGSLIPWGLYDFHCSPTIYIDNTWYNCSIWRRISTFGVSKNVDGFESNLFVLHKRLQTSVPDKPLPRKYF